MLPKYIKKASDLITTHQATCSGFLEQAVAKVDRIFFLFLAASAMPGTANWYAVEKIET